MSDMEYRGRPMHGGIISAMGKMDAECNLYCRDGEHCDLWYSQSVLTLQEWQKALRGITIPPVLVTKVEPATEAGPIPAHFVSVGVKNEFKPVTAWLVFWRVNLASVASQVT